MHDTKENLRIGRIPFTNLFPIFHYLEKARSAEEYEFVDGSPAQLNRAIREGEIDVSPSSSIEYLRHREKYILIGHNSISCYGPIGSILLFSKKKIEDLSGCSICTTSQSETSVALQQIILKKFVKTECLMTSVEEPLCEVLRSHDAYLLIGDRALTEARDHSDLYVYDLCELWQQFTGLPFTFAVWIAGKSVPSRKALSFPKFLNDLDEAKHRAAESFEALAEVAPIRAKLPKEEIIAYWNRISFDMNNDHMRGLGLFEKYAIELGLIV